MKIIGATGGSLDGVKGVHRTSPQSESRVDYFYPRAKLATAIIAIATAIIATATAIVLYKHHGERQEEEKKA